MYLHLHWKELKLGSSPAPLNQSGGRFFINSSFVFVDFSLTELLF